MNINEYIEKYSTIKKTKTELTINMKVPPRKVANVISEMDRLSRIQDLDRYRRFNLMMNNYDDILMGPDRSVQGPSALAFGFPGKFSAPGLSSFDLGFWSRVLKAECRARLPGQKSRLHGLGRICCAGFC